MTSTTIPATPDLRLIGRLRETRSGVWLLAGCLSAMLSCGGRLDLGVLAWLTPVLLIRFARTARPAFSIVGVFAAMLAQSLAYFGLTAIPLNPMTLLLGAIVSAAYSLPYVVDRMIGGRLPTLGRTFLFPTLSVAIEFAVGSILPLGTAVGMRAITQGENPALLQVTSITGPYAIAFLIGCGATVANRIVEAPSEATSRRQGAIMLATLLAVVLLGQARLVTGQATPAAETVKIAAITPDRDTRRAASELLSGAQLPVPPALALRANSSEARKSYRELWRRLFDETRIAAQAGAKIVAWSETAAPAAETDKREFLGQTARVAREEGVYILASVGVPFERNETFLFSPEGRQLWHYRKNHPVPGMEPVAPFENAVPVVPTPYGRLASVICFDADFPALARVEADILLTPSWDWPEVADAHTTRMVRLRAIENGYALVRPVFDGLTGAYDPYGRTLAIQSTTTRGAHTMIVDVPIRKVWTVYSRIGEVFSWLCIATAIVLILAGLRAAARARV